LSAALASLSDQLSVWSRFRHRDRDRAVGHRRGRASRDLSLVNVLIFPSQFTAGMSLNDTTDSVLMVGAYGWALLDPVRKL
jgi:High-affinity nickel-transport protein